MSTTRLLRRLSLWPTLALFRATMYLPGKFPQNPPAVGSNSVLLDFHCLSDKTCRQSREQLSHLQTFAKLLFLRTDLRDTGLPEPAGFRSAVLFGTFRLSRRDSFLLPDAKGREQRASTWRVILDCPDATHYSST